PAPEPRLGDQHQRLRAPRAGPGAGAAHDRPAAGRPLAPRPRRRPRHAGQARRPHRCLSVPVRPMLGCIGTAPAPANGAPRTGDSGDYGGNMDFNEVVEGATVYLPVAVPGALLYFGDGHALQGDGELNGDALETSLDVEITVEV